MIQILGHNMGGKGVDFGIVTDPSTVVKTAIFLSEKTIEIGDYCLIDDNNFLTPEEQKSLLYLLASKYEK